jgi:hypothetical protein
VNKKRIVREQGVSLTQLARLHTAAHLGLYMLALVLSKILSAEAATNPL